VSKVLRNAYGVSDAMRDRVTRAIEELGYRPQAAARAMRGRSFTIGLVLPHIRNPFFSTVVDGLTEHVSGSGYQVIMVQGGGLNQAAEHQAVEALVDRQVDGILLIAPLASKARLEEIAKITPTVVLGRHDRSGVYDAVLDDDEAGTTLTVEHLIALGHRRIAHISHKDSSSTGPASLLHAIRAKTYQRVMTEHGLEEHIAIAATFYTEDGGYQGARRLLTAEPRPTAIFAGADLAAFGALAAFHEAGLKVPDDISVAGYDNTTMAALAHISLTSVDQDGTIMGKTAGRLLLERVEGRTTAVRFVVTPTLVPRRSTGPAPG
jgi:LacI family transcriptional regulator